MHVYDEAGRAALTDGSYAAAKVVVPLLLEHLPVRSVVDVGCGTGGWLRGFVDHGVGEVWGMDMADAARHGLLITADRFEAVDLTQPVALRRRADLAMSIEVGEHLPASRAAGIVAELTAIADVVLFSAAIPGAARAAVGGPRDSGHINEQWPSYWAALFAQHGFDAYDCIRPLVWDDRSVPIAVRQHVLVYALPHAVPDTIARTKATYVDVVHPQWVETLEAEIAQPGLRQVAKVPRALWRAIRRRL